MDTTVAAMYRATIDDLHSQLAQQTERADALQAENERLRKALHRIAEWPYDIMGDCVADARREAAEAAREKSDATK
jgi:regulator of replication initiation timing